MKIRIIKIFVWILSKLWFQVQANLGNPFAWDKEKKRWWGPDGPGETCFCTTERVFGSAFDSLWRCLVSIWRYSCFCPTSAASALTKFRHLVAVLSRRAREHEMATLLEQYWKEGCRCTGRGGLETCDLCNKTEGILRELGMISGRSAHAQKLRYSPKPRLVIDALCTACGVFPGADLQADFQVPAALRHVANTGHVIVLNGTADLPPE